jgi:competence protein ComEC
MFHRIPFFRFTVSLIAGIAFFEYVAAPRYEPLVLHRFILAGLFILLFLFIVGRHFLKSKVQRGIIFFAFFFLGVFGALLHEEDFQNDVSTITDTDYESYLAVVVSLPERREKSYRLECSIVKVRDRKDALWKDTEVKALVNVPITASLIPPGGSIVLVNGALSAPKPPGNPGEFDYRLFLKRKGVAWTAYWTEGSYQVVGSRTQDWNPLQWSWAVSSWASSVLRNAIQEDDSYGLVRAMILGRRDDLRGELIDNYVASGTVHVLSVSGLHVGVFFTIIAWSLGWLKRFRRGKLLNFVALAGLLIFYGLITGMPPCVQRAIIMCLTWALADVLVKDQEPVNTLSFSAFVILLIDPYALMDVGFQLSYLAILGIVLFYRSIEGLLYFSSRVMKYVWQVSALSVAAQITTFPLSIFYFHQFPTYFLLVNPLVIALTSLLLPVTMVFLLMSLVPFAGVAGIIGQLLEWIAWLTNLSVMVPKLLPGYLMEGLYINGFEMVLLFLVLFTVWVAFYFRVVGLVRTLAVLSLWFACYSIYCSYTIYKDRSVVFHQIPRHTVVSVKIGHKAFLFSDTVFLRDQGGFNFKLKNYLIMQSISRKNVVYVKPNERVLSGSLLVEPLRGALHIQIDSKRALIGEDQQCVDANYYLINAEGFPLTTSFGIGEQTVILLGGTMKKNVRDHWERAVVCSGYSFHDLEQKGALSVSW